MRTLVLSLTLSLLAAGGPQRVATQDVAPVPRTPWGDPDLQGLWNYSTNTFLQRHPDHADREWLTEEEIAAANLEWSTFATSERRSELTPEYDLSLNFNQVWWDLGNSTGRTSLITDPSNGRLPPLTPEQEAYRATPEWQRLQQSEMGLRTRCLLDREVPIRPSSDNDNVHILQAPGYVVIFYEKIHSVRIIPVTDQPGVTGRIRQWLGVSRGHWEGGTLVVETENFDARADLFGSGSNLHVAERFTRRGEDAIRYSFTVTDPSVWTQSWSAQVPFRATEAPIFEYACHEGNYSMPLMLRGARVAPYPPLEAFQVIDAAPDKGFNFPYILRVPDLDQVTSPTFLLVEPNNTGTGSDDFDVHVKAAEDLSRSAIGNRLFSALNVPLLVPVFPRPRMDWHIYTHALDRDTLGVNDGPLRRLDLQLLAMIDDARARLNGIGLKTRQKVLLTGFSASGTFANRFTVLHPNRIQAVTTGGVNGSLMLPTEAIDAVGLPYPLGVADLEELAGAPFDIDAWRKVPQFIYMGADDQNDAVLFDDGYAPEEERSIVFAVLGERMQPDGIVRLGVQVAQWANE